MDFLNRRRTLAIVGAAISIAAVFFLRAWVNKKPQDTARLLDKNGVGQSFELFDAINGRKVPGLISLLRPLAVMVENHPDARPQSGLSSADIVYETLTEGGITRFLAIYQSQDVNWIGSVRSAREYFAQLADEWGALYAHAGGSNEVIRQLENRQYKYLADANEYYNLEFFPRRKDKPEPHHLFTSTKDLRRLIEYHRFSNLAGYQPWPFKDDSPADTSTASKISVDFSRAGYEVGWEYDPSQNGYKRLQYFQPHIDELSGRQITAKTVVVQIVDATPVPNDPLLQVDIDLTSGGRAIIFMDGIFIEAAWRKEAGRDASVGANRRTRFYDLRQNEIRFNRGPVWIELFPKARERFLKWT